MSSASDAPEKKGEHVVVDADYVRKDAYRHCEGSRLSRYIL